MDEKQNKVLSLGNAVLVSGCDLNATFLPIHEDVAR